MLVIVQVYDATGKPVHMSVDYEYNEDSRCEPISTFDLCELLRISPLLSPVSLSRPWSIFKGE